MKDAAAIENDTGASFATRTVIGRIVSMDDQGEIFVAYDGSGVAPKRALLSLAVSKTAVTELRRLGPKSVRVVLLLGDELPSPIIVDLVVDPKVVESGYSVIEEKDGSLRINASREIVIACGKSSITLRSDGRVVIRGRELTSRASGSNKMRGSTISLN